MKKISSYGGASIRCLFGFNILIFLIGWGGLVQAQDECGAAVGGVVTCDGSTYTPTSVLVPVDPVNDPTGPTTTVNDNDISYVTSTGLELNVNIPNFQLVTDADPNAAVRNVGAIEVTGVGSGDVSANVSDAEITTPLLFPTQDFTINRQRHGISVRNFGQGSASIATSDVDIQSSSNGGRGLSAVVASASSSGDATVVMNGGSVLTGERDSTASSFTSAFGVVAENFGTGDATVMVNGGDVTTTGSQGFGLRALITNGSSSGTASATLNGGSVTTRGPTAFGIAAQNSGLGDTIARSINGTIETGAAPVSPFGTANGFAVSAQVFNANNTGDATVEVSGGSVTTSGINSVGARIDNNGLGSASVVINNNATIETTGANAEGVEINQRNASSAETVSVEIDGGSVSTSGNDSEGVAIRNSGLGDVNVSVSGATSGSSPSINTTGDNSHGILIDNSNAASSSMISVDLPSSSVARSVRTEGDDANALRIVNQGSGEFDIDIGSNITSTGSGDSETLRIISQSGGEVRVGSLGSIVGLNSGFAIREGDADNDGVDEIGVATSVIVNGSVTGNIDLGEGDDTFALGTPGFGGNVQGDLTFGSGSNIADIFEGSFTGNIEFGSGQDILNVSGGVINGDILLGEGDDTINISGGQASLISGDGDSEAATDGNDIFNWTGGAVAGFEGQGGDDQVNANGVTFSGSELFSGGTGDDSFSVASSSGTIDGAAVTGFETIGLTNSDLTINDLVADGAVNTSLVSVCGGNTTFAGSSVLTDINDGGCGASETIVFTDNTTVSGTVDTGAGDDAVEVSGSARLSGPVNTGDGNDTVLLDDSAVVANNISTGAGDDRIELFGGSTVTGTIEGGAGDDFIDLLGSSTVMGTIDGGAGDDIFLISTNGNADTLLGSEGDDFFFISSPNFVSANGGDGSDQFVISRDIDLASIDGGDDSNVADGFIDILELSFLDSSIPGADIVNFESLLVNGGSLSVSDGMLNLATDASFESLVGLNLSSAVLNVASDLRINGNTYLVGGSQLNGFGATTNINGGLLNQGRINLVNGETGDSVIVSGDYAGDGEFDIDVDFANDVSDTLVIGGDVRTDIDTLTRVNVNDITTGDATGNLIPVVDVAGQAQAGQFVLANGPIISGAFFYDFALNERGFALSGSPRSTQEPTPTPTPSPTPTPPRSRPTPPAPTPPVVTPPVVQASFLPQIPTYEVIPQILLGINGADTLQQRELGFERAAPISGLRVRVLGKDLEEDPAFSATGAQFDLDGVQFDLGVQGIKQRATGKWVIGAYVEKQDYSGSVASSFGGGEIDNIDANGVGITGTWYDNHGWYMDLHAGYRDYDLDLRPFSLIEQTTTDGAVTATEIIQNTGQFDLNDQSADGVVFSAEFGKRFAYRNFTLVPQVQLSYSDVDMDEFTGFNGERVNIGDGERTTLRLGMSLHTAASEKRDFMAYLSSNLRYRFDEESSLLIGGLELQTETDQLYGELGVGAVYKLSSNMRLKGDLRYSSSLENFGDSDQVIGSASIERAF